jgi:RNA polymerase sigma-70 factor (ECF subfamily)
MPQHRAPVPSDEELACQARGGCAESFEQLARRYQAPLLHFLRQRGAGADAEDLVQDTFVRAYASLSGYRTDRRFAAWLFTIAHRLCINHHRRRRAAREPALPDSIASGAPPPAEAASAEEQRRGLWAMAARVLSRREWTAVWLYYVEDLPAREIAAVLACSRAAVKTMLFRARKRLLPLLGGLAPEGGEVSRPGARRRKRKSGVLPR